MPLSKIEAIGKIDDLLCLCGAIKEVPRWEREAEAKLSRELQALFAKAERAAMRKLRETGAVPASEIQRSAIAGQVDQIRQEVAETTAEAAIDVAGVSRDVQVETLMEMNREPPVLSRTMRETMRILREKTFEASAGTMSRLRGNVEEVLDRAYREGIGIEKLADQLHDVFEGMKNFETERIARTEIHGAATDAAHATLRDFGVEYKKWVAATDDRTRDTHLDINGEITAMGLPFSNGLMYPGDRDGPIEEWINCRCREVPFIMPTNAHPPTGRDRFREGEIVYS